MSVIAMAAVDECGFELMQHPFPLPALSHSIRLQFISKVEKGHFYCPLLAR